MTTEEDFEIDIYGDANGNDDDGNRRDGYADDDNSQNQNQNQNQNGQGQGHDYDDHGASSNATKQESPSAGPTQGVKRKGSSDDRAIDPGATTAIMVSELSWWITDDDIRGWVAAAQCEAELKDITFSEHKVNGKSKGQAYIEFTSQQAATATKHRIESQASGEFQAGQKRHSVIFSSPTTNPFRTLPKETPGRGGAHNQQNRNVSGSGSYQDRSGGSNNYNNNNNNYGNNNNNYRGRGGGNMYNNRGGMGNQGFNRNFSGGNMNAFNNGGAGPMNFGGAMGGGFNNGGGNFRGNMGGGMRGGGGPGMRGRGGPMGGMMGGMGPGMGGMGGMGSMNPMGNMPGAMGGMGGMGGMGMGMVSGMPNFQGMHPNFTPNFFGAGGGGGGGVGGNPGGGNQGGGEWQNPHGAKRQRPE
ncbi:hypothetical protein SCUCBS95973_008188 [Sporothrix curviconia]|uniref:RRM domain-containing protein n=1 Tax=Sporothrix curviconia TaxID=1260050 RepID=A0ABP0CJT8_9PEZI